MQCFLNQYNYTGYSYQCKHRGSGRKMPYTANGPFLISPGISPAAPPVLGHSRGVFIITVPLFWMESTCSRVRFLLLTKAAN